ncbi:hypothetical protein GCM10010449_39750 [Streptomyces rectiviolaceus]|uniref:Uncharacterized protein n=1 Tax=Streptomyces rectiviolaceus TaxID=332591 RepID=A0ABP6ML15_9ACTN
MFGAHRVGHQFLCLPQDSPGHGPIVQPGYGEHIRAEKSVTQNCPNPWIGTPALFVAGRRERQLFPRLVCRQSVEHRSC